MNSTVAITHPTRLLPISCWFTVVLLIVSCLFSPAKKKWNGSSKPPVEDSVSFLVIGDWGMNGIPVQKKVATQMVKYAGLFNVQFVIATGDNFYPSGVSSIHDPTGKPLLRTSIIRTVSRRFGTLSWVITNIWEHRWRKYNIRPLVTDGNCHLDIIR